MPPILPPMPDCLHYLNAFCLYHSLQFLLQQHRPPLLFFPSLRHNWDEFQSQTQNHSWCFTAVFCVWYIKQRITASPIIQDCLCGGTKHEELNWVFFYNRNQGNGDFPRHWNSLKTHRVTCRPPALADKPESPHWKDGGAHDSFISVESCEV